MKSLLSIFLSFLPVVLWGQDITTVIGTGTAGSNGDGGYAIAAELKSPDGIIFDKMGNKFICDYGNNRIRKINTAGIIVTVAGNGMGSYGGDNGPATDAKLYGPVGIAIDTAGNLYISTSGDHRIRKVNTTGIITTIAGDGTFGYNGDEIPATSAKLYYPYMGKVDGAGNIYFSDYNNHRVRKIDPSGTIHTIAGNGTNSSGGDGGPATNAGLKGPCGLTLGPSGNIYIPDNADRRVRKVDIAMGTITTFAGIGISGDNGDGGPATDAKLSVPNSVAFDNVGNAYIADYGAHKIRRIDLIGTITTAAGNGTAGFGGDGGPATDAMLYKPTYVTTDNVGNVYIADYMNNRIRRITYDYSAVNNTPTAALPTAIHPNPATTSITITTPTEIKDIAVLDVMGREVTPPLSFGEGPGERLFSIAHLPPGMYFVKVNGMYAGKFVKE